MQRARTIALRALLRLGWAAALLASAAACGEPESPCDGVTCSGHGECRSDGTSLWCECESGYRPRGLECVADSCPVDLAVVHTSFEDFSRGSFPRSLENLYVSHGGDVRSIHATDVNLDGHADVVFSNTHVFSGGREDHDVPSYVYLGEGERRFGATPLELPAVGAAGWLAADLDADGFLDLAFAGSQLATWVPGDSSPIYWGSPSGPDPAASPTELEAMGIRALAAADLDRDGYLDLVAASWLRPGPAFDTTSYVYWGGADGFSNGRRAAMPTYGATGAFVADLDEDGALDIVFSCCCWDDPPPTNPPSLVYFGPDLWETDRTELEGMNATATEVADLDGDGHLDVVIANRCDFDPSPDDHLVDSYVYWGEGDGTFADRTGLPTMGVGDVAIADLDGDGHLDVVFANGFDNRTREVDSFIYWGRGGRDFGGPTRLATVGAYGVMAADLDADGRLDLVFSNHETDGALHEIDSYVYWGEPSGRTFSVESMTRLPTLGPTSSPQTGFGNVHDRGPLEVYESPAVELPAGATVSGLLWIAEAPADASIRLALRSAAAVEELSEAPWVDLDDPDGDGAVALEPASFAGHRAVQYQVTFDLGTHRSVAVLHEVRICLGE